MTHPPIQLTVQGVTVKALRESLASAQATLLRGFEHYGIEDNARPRAHIQNLQAVIAACDVLRPLGPDGVHGTGERCTPDCGCESPEGCNLRDRP